MPPKTKTTQNIQPLQIAGQKRKRTRNGCLTCRDRHLKCDENYPVCNNCTKSKRECLRGIRLKFLNTNISELEVNPYSIKTTGSINIMDQSAVTASHYKGGLQSYGRYLDAYSQSDLMKAETDFNRYLDVNIASEEQASKLAKSKGPHDARSNSYSFKTLLDDFLKFESTDNDEEMAILSDPSSAKFNYIDPPTGLATYLENIKVHKGAKDRQIEQGEISDYYIFDSDEESDNLLSPPSSSENLHMDPISDENEIFILSNYLESTRWFLNGLTDTTVYDYWLNCIINEKSLKDEPTLKFLLKASAPISGIISEKVSDIVTSETERRLKEYLANCENKHIDTIATETDAARNMQALTLLITGHFQNSCQDQKKEASLGENLGRYYKIFIEKATKTSVLAFETLGLCISPVFVVDVFSSIMFETQPVFNPFKMDDLIAIRTTDYDFKTVHSSSKQKFQNSFNYTESYNSDIDESEDDEVNDMDIDGMTASGPSVTNNALYRKPAEPNLTDPSYLITIISILGKLNYVLKFQPPGSAQAWEGILSQLVYYEQNFPFVFSPISIGPLKTQAAQGLATMGLAEDSPIRDFAADPPFPMIKFANEMALVIHIVHHAVYLFSEKYKPDSYESYFKHSKEYLKFRTVLWYNETVPQDDHGIELERLNMARRLVSFFLSYDKVQKRRSENIWFYYSWCFELAKDFLPGSELKEIDKRLAE